MLVSGNRGLGGRPDWESIGTTYAALGNTVTCRNLEQSAVPLLVVKALAAIAEGEKERSKGQLL